MNNKLFNSMVALIIMLIPKIIFAQAPNLGAATNFGVFTAVGAFNNMGTTAVNGDIGTNVGVFSGFPPGTVIGAIHIADAASASAAPAVLSAYGSLSTVSCGVVIGTTMGSGQVLTPNVYCTGAASTLNGNLTLDGQGNPNSIFIFKINGMFSTGTFSTVTLINGASVCNVFWQVNGEFILGDFSVFRGNILVNGAITLLEASKLTGRALSTSGAVNLHNNMITLGLQPTASIISANGPTTLCAGESLLLSGNVGGTWSTGATTPTITVNTSGDYFVTNTSVCGSINSNHIIVNVNPQQTCSISGSNSICLGQSTPLCVPSGSSAYLWSTGATTNCVSVNAAGLYSVTVTDQNGCKSICSKTITLGQQSVCLITGSSNICQGQSTQYCVPSGSANYIWSTGATTNCITVSLAGTYAVTATNASGCSSVCSKVLTVTPQTSCTISGPSSICSGQTASLCVPVGSAGYLWSTAATTNCISVTTAGNYFVTTTDSNGCTTVCNKIVTVGTQSTCIITGNGNICQGQSTQFCVPVGSSSYFWSTGATTNCISVSIAGTYAVTATDPSGCINVCSKVLTVGQPSICSITGNSSICQGQSTQLCAVAGASSYLWSNGATSTCLTVSAPGTYTVSITESNGCNSTCTKILNNGVIPNCAITGNDVICLGQTTQLCAPAGASSYVWSNGSTSNCTTVATSGLYIVTVTSANGCSSICNRLVTNNLQNSGPVTGNDVICQGQSTQLCISAGAASYNWSNGETSNCMMTNTPGLFSVTATYSNGCTDVFTKLVSDLVACNLITGNNSICQGQTTQFCATAGAAAYLWSTGATSSCITVSVAGNYLVTVTDALGATETCSRSLSVNALPNCTISGVTVLCPGKSTTLFAALGFNTYLWSTGASSDNITVNTAGTYTVTTTNSNGCSSICSKVVTLSVPFICTISGPDNICTGSSIQLCSPIGASSYLWSTGGTTNCISVVSGGTYSVTATSIAGCTSVCSKTIIESAYPVGSIQGSDFICNGQVAQLCTPANGNRFLWSTGATTACITIASAATYSLTITNPNGCSNTTSKAVVNTMLQSCVVTGSEFLCQGQTVQLCLPPGSTYAWNTGETTFCIGVQVAGDYSVTVTNENGCSSTCSKRVYANPVPVCTITGRDTICQGQDAQLCVPTGQKYIWSNGQTSSCITVDTTGLYSVTVTNTSRCSMVCSKLVVVVPPCSIRGIDIICEGESTDLCAGTGASYRWSNGLTSRCITVNAAGTYGVTVTQSNGCTSVCSKIISTFPAPTNFISGTCMIQLCSPDGSAYLWSNGATTQCIYASVAGNYFVTVTNTNGCSLVAQRIVANSLMPQSTITGNAGLCEGQTTTLCATAGYTYLWSTGATTSCIDVSIAGTYTVSVSNSMGCYTVNSQVVTVSSIPNCTISGPEVILAGETKTFCTDQIKDYTYLWNTGSKNACIYITAPGQYSVSVNNHGCIASCSKTLKGPNSSANRTTSVIGQNMDSAAGNLLTDGFVVAKAFPNPFSSTTNIEFQNTLANSHVKMGLYTLAGIKVASLFDNDIHKGIIYSVNLNSQDLPEKIYICQIINGAQIINEKLVIIKL